MEKSGKITLTPNDLAEYQKGRVSERIQATWGLTFSELSTIIASDEYLTSTGDHE